MQQCVKCGAEMKKQEAGSQITDVSFSCTNQKCPNSVTKSTGWFQTSKVIAVLATIGGVAYEVGKEFAKKSVGA